MRLSRRVRLWRTLSSFSDVRESLKLFGMKPSGAPVSLSLKPLGGRQIVCRPGTTDLRTMYDTFVKRYHLPPARLEAPRCIVDLGANVGYTAAHFASLYPTARIVGVEMETANYDLASRNTSSWSDRVTMIQAAVWSEDGYATFGGETEDGYAVSEWVADDAGQPPAHAVRSRSVDSILREHRIERVDYLKMDIEGAEKDVLLDGATDWLARVVSMSVEIHGDADMTPYIRTLEEAGFRCWKDRRHWCCVSAVRDDTQPRA